MWMNREVRIAISKHFLSLVLDLDSELIHPPLMTKILLKLDRLSIKFFCCAYKSRVILTNKLGIAFDNNRDVTYNNRES